MGAHSLKEACRIFRLTARQVTEDSEHNGGSSERKGKHLFPLRTRESSFVCVVSSGWPLDKQLPESHHPKSNLRRRPAAAACRPFGLRGKMVSAILPASVSLRGLWGGSSPAVLDTPDCKGPRLWPVSKLMARTMRCWPGQLFCTRVKMIGFSLKGRRPPPASLPQQRLRVPSPFLHTRPMAGEG